MNNIVSVILQGLAAAPEAEKVAAATSSETIGANGTGLSKPSQIQQWRTRRALQALENAKGSGTSMITLMIPAGGQLSQTGRKITEEVGAAAHIKSRVTRQSVQWALASLQHRLGLYKHVPPKGLVILVGAYADEEGKERKLSVDFEPVRRLDKSLYFCGSSFNVQPLKELLAKSDRYGFIVVDGKGALFGLLTGTSRSRLHHFTVDLPKKHRKGGQSAQRFGRNRQGCRHAYLNKVAEAATDVFLSGMGDLLVKNIVVAGSAELKEDLAAHQFLDPRLQAVVLATVDVAYGGNNGFKQAVSLVQHQLGALRLSEEQGVIDGLFTEIARDSNKYSLGAADTLAALERGAVTSLVVWEQLDLRTPDGKRPLIDWLVDCYQDHGAALELVTDRSPEGQQFVRGFGGIAGVLRYPIDHLAEAAGLEYDSADDSDAEDCF